MDYPVKEIISAIEAFLGTKSNYVEVSKGSCFDIDLNGIQPILEKMPGKFDNGYLAKLLVKYFK